MRLERQGRGADEGRSIVRPAPLDRRAAELTFAVDPFCVHVVVDTLVEVLLLRVVAYGLDLDDAAASCTTHADFELRGRWRRFDGEMRDAERRGGEDAAHGGEWWGGGCGRRGER